LQDGHNRSSSNLGTFPSGLGSSITHQHQLSLTAGLAGGGDHHEGACGWPPLQHVEVCSGCSIANLHKLLHHCTGLLHLQLDSLGPNGNGVAAALVGRAPQLTALQLSGCSSMSESACSSIGNQLHDLQELHLQETAIPATHMMALLRGLAGRSQAAPTAAAAVPGSCCYVKGMPLQRLVHLRIERCGGFTDEVVTRVVMQLLELRVLEVVGCAAVSGGALLSLVGRLVKLTRMMVAGCQGVRADFERVWQRAAAELRRGSQGGQAGLGREDNDASGCGDAGRGRVHQMLSHQQVIWQP
jgi:hypothetical protein